MLEVSNISSKETGGSSEEGNGNTGRLGGDGLVSSNDTIFLQPLDTLQVGAGSNLGVHDFIAVKFLLALSRGQVSGGTKGVDVVGLVVVLVTVGIVVVVVSISISSILISCQTGHAVGGNDGIGCVGNVFSSVVLLVVSNSLLGWNLAAIIIKEAKGDGTSLSTALGSKVVLDDFIAVLIELGIGTGVISRALDGLFHIHQALVVLSIFIVVAAHGTVDTISLVAVVPAHSLVALITLVVASLTVGLTSCLGCLLFIGDVSLEECV